MKQNLMRHGAPLAAAMALLAFLVAAALMFAPPPPPPALSQSETAPDAPTGLAAAAGDGEITLSWNDPNDSSITRYEYNVNHNDTSTGNLSGWSDWTAIAGSGPSTTSHTFGGLANGREYRYHLRAVNAHGPSVGAPAAGPPWFAAATPTAAPTITVTDITATTATVAIANHSGAWRYRVAVQNDGATAYNGDGGTCAGPVPGSETTITGLEPNSQYTVNAYANADGCDGGAAAQGQFTTAQGSPPAAPSSVALTRTGEGFRGKGTLTADWPAVTGATKYHINYTADKGRTWTPVAAEHTTNSITFDIWNGYTYYVRVSAGNANGWSGWTSSAESAPIPAPLPPHILPGPESVTVTRRDGTVIATWPAVDGAIKYRVEYSDDLRGFTYHLVSDNHTSTRISFDADNSKPYTVAVRAGKSDNYFSFGPLTYSARSDPFSPRSLTASNLDLAPERGAETGQYFANNHVSATAFTTGGVASGYKLHSVALDIYALAGAPTGFTAAIHAADGDGNPAASATYTLAGDAPAAAGRHTFTCAGVCRLSAGTTYFLVVSATGAAAGANYYDLDVTGSADQAVAGNGAGWSIADELKRQTNNGGWVSHQVGRAAAAIQFNVSATIAPGLAASGVTGTTATLTLSNYDRAWWYQRTSPTGDDTCHSVAAGTDNDALTGLAGVYTYKAYDVPGCDSADEIASVSFTTRGTHDSSKDFHTYSSQFGIWSDGATMYVQTYVGFPINEAGIGAFDLATKSRDDSKDFSLHADNHPATGLWSDGTTMWVGKYLGGDKLYAYNVAMKGRDASKDFSLHADNDDASGLWSDGTTLWVADFTDRKLYAYNLSDASRVPSEDFNTLSDAGNHAPYGMWSDGVTMWVPDFSDGKVYAYKRSDKSHDAAKDYELATVNEEPVGLWSDGVTMYVADRDDSKIYAYYSMDSGAKLSAHYVKATTAMLYVGGHLDAWWYQRTAPSGDATCQSVAAGTKSASLSSLTASTAYTYKAYDKAGCNSADELATATFTTPVS